MRRSMKYFIPFFSFVAAAVLIVLQAWIQQGVYKNALLQKAPAEVRFLGERLSQTITLASQSKSISQQILMDLIAPYTRETIDFVELYDHHAAKKFMHHVASSVTPLQSAQISIVSKVLAEQFSYIEIDQNNEFIEGYFPVDLSGQKAETGWGDKGVVYFRFDLSGKYANAQEMIKDNVLMNAVTVMMVLAVFLYLSYIFVFRGLDRLYDGAKRVSKGDMSTLIRNGGDDELGEVIRTFNDMTLQMSAYKHKMEDQIETEVEQRSKQNSVLLHQNRLASMGEMIGNIAHQWRQPLNALGLILQKMDIMSQRDQLSSDAVQLNTKRAMALIAKMSTTIDDFRGFFRPDKQKENFNLKSLMQEVFSLFQSSLEHENITLELDIPPYCEIYGYKNEFSQVMINLINNSKDAFREKDIDHAKILISAMQNDQTVTVMVADNAGGIPLAVIDRIFEPYYTTKEEGKGTGIGLYMSKMIVEDNMHGSMSVTNTPNGAMFKISFTKKEDA